MTLELTAEEMALLKEWREWSLDDRGLVIIHKLQAQVMKASFQLKHVNCDYWTTVWNLTTKAEVWICEEKIRRHTWTDEQWLEAAKKELTDTEA